VKFVAFDAAYVASLCSGDRGTEQHFQSYFSELIRLKLRSRFLSPAEIDDIEQETFVRAFKLVCHQRALRQAERLGALINSICNHVLSERYRAQKKVEELEEEKAAVLCDTRPGVLDELLTGETQRLVRDVLDDLPHRDRLILEAIFLEERDKDAVCEQMKVDRAYLRVLLHRAKQAFRSGYDERRRSEPESAEIPRGRRG